MLAVQYEVHNLLKQVAILLSTLLSRRLLGILLQGPHSPQKNIRMVHLINLIAERLARHKLLQCLLGGAHHVFKLIQFIHT